MLDIKLIRDNPDAVKQALATRKADADIDGLLALDAARRAAITEAEELKSTRNSASKAIGGLMKEGKKAEADAAKEEVRQIGDRIAALDEQVRELDEKILNTFCSFPICRDRLFRSVKVKPTIRFSALSANPKNSTSKSSRTGTSAKRSNWSTSNAAPKSPAPAFPSIPGRAPNSSARSSSLCSTCTPNSTAIPKLSRPSSVTPPP
jgi:seryl-tRNA synthetase